MGQREKGDVMKMRLKTAVLLALVLFCVVLPSIASEGDKLDELSGILKKNVKALSHYFLEIDGVSSIGLRGDVLEKLPDGTLVWVKGKIHSTLFGPCLTCITNYGILFRLLC